MTRRALLQTVGGRGKDCRNRDVLLRSLLKNGAKERKRVTPK
jgi:hypothetical protein